MFRQLDVSRTGHCQWEARDESDRSKENLALDARVAALHAESDQSYGGPRIVEALVAEGSPLVHERVRQSLLRRRSQARAQATVPDDDGQ